MNVFVGCYTEKINEEIVGKGEGIYCFEFNTTLGKLKLKEIIAARNPSYLTLSKDGKFLYAVDEVRVEKQPKIRSYKVNSGVDSTILTLINEQDLLGSFACHLSLSDSQKYLLVASYMSGNVLVYPLNMDGGLLPLTQNIQHHGTGPNLVRQEAAHAHMICPFKENKIYVVDLGIDMAKSYVLEESTGRLNNSVENDIKVNPGSGPRHMVVHPEGNNIFIFTELSAEVHSFKRVNGQFKLLEIIPMLPADYMDVPSGAAIRIHPNGKYLYVSNRGSNTIGILKFDKVAEKLSLIGHQPSGGKTPREINIDPSGRWLICANQDSHNLTVFSIDQETGLLEFKNVNEELGSPSCILFDR